jgi:hypothetical protein
MDLLRIAPTVEVNPEQIHGCTPWLAQLLLLFSCNRSVTVDRRRQHVRVANRWLWVWERVRTIPFDRVARIVYRAQGIPSFSPYRYLSSMSSDSCDSAFFLISIAVKDAAEDKRAHEEIMLFTVWEQQPRDIGWIDKLAGLRVDPRRLGDETSGAIVDRLHEFLGVPVASH